MLRRGEFMVAVAAAVGLCYGVSAVAFSTGQFRRCNGRRDGVLASIFKPMDAGCTCYMMNVFRGEGRVAVDGGNRHGGVVFGRNLYGDSRRLMYRTGVLLGKLSTFRTMLLERSTFPIGLLSGLFEISFQYHQNSKQEYTTTKTRVV